MQFATVREQNVFMCRERIPNLGKFDSGHFIDSIETMNVDSRLHSLPYAIFNKSEFLDEFEFYRTLDKAPGFPHIFF
jgi:hypothetical protein